MKQFNLIITFTQIFSVSAFSQNNSRLSQIAGVDGATIDVYPPYIIKDKVFHPYVEVIYELLDASNNVVLTNTQSFSGLDLNTLEKKKLKLDTDWLVVIAGNFKIKCTLNVAFDTDPSNNVFEEGVESIALSYNNIATGAGYVSSKTNFYKTDVNNTALESITTFTEEIIFVGLDFIDDVLYGVYTLGQIEYEFFMNGISWDETETTNKVYLVGGQGFNYSDLFELDKEALEIELVTRMDQFGENAYVAIEFDSEGLNWQNTCLEVIDVVTGQATPMPNQIGYYNYSSGQGFPFNKSDDKLYGSVFDFNPTCLTFTSINTTTGVAVEIEHINGKNVMSIAFPNSEIRDG